MYIKKNPRVTFRSNNRRSNFKRSNNFSNNKTKNKGNVTQQYNKYLKLAKEAFSSGDRVQSEYYYQFTDHYYRLMLELGITLEEDIEEGEGMDMDSSSEEIISVKEKKDENEIVKEVVDLVDQDEDENIESIESIPFISKPAKKKSTKAKKVSV